MTEEQINIGIAKSLGWTGITYVEATDNWVGNKPGGGRFRFPVKKYTASRDACAEFEAKLTDEQRTDYWMLLRSITGSALDAAFASAPRRCEAYLRMIGKWKESMFVDASGHDHRAVRCEEMIDIDCDTKHVGEKATCCVCAGHGCEAARQERIKHPKQDNTKA